jgi:Glycosyltransferase family 29 (sialyltransferase)
MRGVNSVALIGNGKIDERLWFDINRHDLIVRFNACKHFGVTTGRRTDVVVFVNTGFSGQKLALERDTVDNAAIAAAKEFWFSAPADVIAHEFVNNPTNQDAPTYRDHPGDWIDFSDDLQRHRCVGRPCSFIESEHFFGAQNLLKAHGAKNGTRPSTGFLALYKIRNTLRPSRVSLYGFQHFGWPGHPWDAEKSAIDAMPEVCRRETGSRANAYFTEAGRRYRTALDTVFSVLPWRSSRAPSP